MSVLKGNVLVWNSFKKITTQSSALDEQEEYRD